MYKKFWLLVFFFLILIELRFFLYSTWFIYWIISSPTWVLSRTNTLVISFTHRRVTLTFQDFLLNIFDMFVKFFKTLLWITSMMSRGIQLISYWLHRMIIQRVMVWILTLYFLSGINLRFDFRNWNRLRLRINIMGSKALMGTYILWFTFILFFGILRLCLTSPHFTMFF